MAEKKDTTANANKDESHSQRFTALVLREYNNVPGGLALTDYQRELIQHYFIKTDMVLKKAEQDRLAKNERNSDHKYDNTLPVTWGNVNLDQMALDVVHYAKLGLDPTMENHLHPIPYKNTKAQKYDVGFIVGYKGKEYVALEHALVKPSGLVYDLVYSNDVFRPHMRSLQNQIESYDFDIVDPFDRGELRGGFFYVMYDEPTMNRLYFLSKKDIEKRKPSYASPEFWGGVKKYKDRDTGKWVEEKLDGWYEQMALKTIVRFGCDKIGLDPKKINSSYMYVEQRQAEYDARRVDEDINANANAGPVVDVEAPVVPVDEQPAQDEPEVVFPADEKAAQQQTFFQQGKK
jgi:recombination protein RecT